MNEVSPWGQYFALESALNDQEASSPPDNYWLAKHVNYNSIRLMVASPDNTQDNRSRLSIPGCIYESLYNASIKSSNDVQVSLRLSNLSRLVAFLTNGKMTVYEQRVLEERAKFITSYAGDIIKITDELREDIKWLSAKFDLNAKLSGQDETVMAKPQLPDAGNY